MRTSIWGKNDKNHKFWKLQQTRSGKKLPQVSAWVSCVHPSVILGYLSGCFWMDLAFSLTDLGKPIAFLRHGLPWLRAWVKPEEAPPIPPFCSGTLVLPFQTQAEKLQLPIPGSSHSLPHSLPPPLTHSQEALGLGMLRCGLGGWEWSIRLQELGRLQRGWLPERINPITNGKYSGCYA